MPRPATVPEIDAITVTVHLWIRPSKRAEFDAFEEQAFAIMRDHGAEILEIHAMNPAQPNSPDEIHVLRFPSQCAFDAYRVDPRLAALKPQRDRCIADTRIEITSEPD